MSQRRRIDTLLNLLRLCKGHVIYERSAKNLIFDFIEMTNGRINCDVFIIFRCINNQITPGRPKPKSAGRHKRYYVDPHLCAYIAGFFPKQ